MRIEQMFKAIEHDKPAEFFSLWAHSTLDQPTRLAILQKAEANWGPGQWMISDLRLAANRASRGQGAGDQKIFPIPRIPHQEVTNKESIFFNWMSFTRIYKAQYQGQTIALKPAREYKKEKLEIEANFLMQAQSNYVVGFMGILTANEKEHEPESLILEYADGGSLYDTLLDSKISISPMQQMIWAEQCSDAVGYIHSLEMIHLDIKSLNFVLKDGQIKLIDFEYTSKQTGSLQSNRKSQPATPPEGYYSRPSCDVFCLGTVLFEILTRKDSTFSGKRLADWVGDHQPIPFPEETPPVFKLTISACLQRTPEERPTAQWVRNQFHWALKSLESISPAPQNKKRKKNEDNEEKSVIRILPTAQGGGIVLSPVLLLYLFDFLTIKSTMSYIQTSKFNHEKFSLIKKSWLLQKIHYHFPRNYGAALGINSTGEMVHYYRKLSKKYYSPSEYIYGKGVSIFQLIKERRIEEAIAQITALSLNNPSPEKIYSLVSGLFIYATDIEGNTVINWANKFSEQKFLDYCFQNFISVANSSSLKDEVIFQYEFWDRIRADLHKNQFTLPALCLFALAFTCRQPAIYQEILESPAWQAGFIHESGWSLLTWAVLLNNEDLLRLALNGLSDREIQKMLLTPVRFRWMRIFLTSFFPEENFIVNPIQLAMALNKKSLLEYCFGQDWGRDAGLLDPGLNYYLYFGIANNDQKMVRQLLLNKANPNGEEKNHYGSRRPLLIALEAKSSISIVRILLEYKADLPQPRANYEFLLTSAVREGSRKTVESLLKLKAALIDNNNPSPEPLNSALNEAMVMGHWDIVDSLLRHKADLNATLKKHSSLNDAVWKVNIKMFYYLLRAGAAPRSMEFETAIRLPNSEMFFLVCFYLEKKTVQDYIAREISYASPDCRNKIFSNVRNLTQKYGLNPQSLFVKLKPVQRALLEFPQPVSGNLPGATPGIVAGGV